MSDSKDSSVKNGAGDMIPASVIEGMDRCELKISRTVLIVEDLLETRVLGLQEDPVDA